MNTKASYSLVIETLAFPEPQYSLVIETLAFPEPKYSGVLRHLLHQLCFLAGADITEVFTREGDNAILPCALDSPVDLTDEAFDWKKEPQEVFFYIQGKDYNNGREGQDPQFVGRVGLTQGGLQAGNASVVLSSVTQADSGVYKCVILTRRTNRWIRLTVVVEPRLRLEVVEASPSSGSVRLSCVSRGGQPQPSGLEWQTPNGTVIPAEEAPPAASSDSDGRYSISQTVKVTEPGSYTCLARQQGVHPAVRDTIQVVGHRLTGDHEEVLGNGPWTAICVSIIVLLILSVVVNIYQFTKNNNRRKGHGQQAVPDSDCLDRSGAYLSCPHRDAAVQLNVPSFG
ncbi:selection and upkeep of intraepithelial T-cells protein 3 [Gadus morhua]|uniref:selection and upkeep of intraepithelial T-cells protein 3 n=1 Tax=Gadus morhua TaxID=8049 RepID=UPI0011B5C757|nr:selection and upkeep of intraepithelial T-cells protein 3-like [Gadus morhua]